MHITYKLMRLFFMMSYHKMSISASVCFAYRGTPSLSWPSLTHRFHCLRVEGPGNNDSAWNPAMTTCRWKEIAAQPYRLPNMLLHPVEQALVNSQSILKWLKWDFFVMKKPNGFQSVLRTAWNQWGWWHPPLGTTSCKLLPPGTQYLFKKWRHCWQCRQKSLVFLDCRFDGPVGSEGFWKNGRTHSKNCASHSMFAHTT